jgi:acyl carrier protein/ribosomal protein S18 acetylase RimI-like enzyme
MSQDAVLNSIVGILRRDTLAESGRFLSPTAHLGETGLGLDSLALVAFITALEKRFRVLFPDEIWTDRERMTLQKIAAFIAAAGPEPVPNEGEDSGSTTATSRWRKAVDRLRGQGLVKSAKWAVRSRLLKRQSYYILEFDLRNRVIPTFSAALDLDFRAASREDLAALKEFWSSFPYRTGDSDELMSENIFRSRLDADQLCLAAWHKGQVAGVDWIFDKGYPCPFTGLTYDWPDGTCYAMELNEHPAFRGKGIGIALLARSLHESKDRGYRRQVTIVRAANVKMLAASVQLFGFQKIGRIDTDWMFGRPFSKWTIGERSGRSRLLMM